MKRIVAFVKPNMLDDVIFALHEIEGFPGANIMEVQSTGSGAHTRLGTPDRTPYREFPKTIRLEIVCPASTVEDIVTIIRTNAHTGRPDDGTIYISPVEEAIRIRTGERGESAI